MKDFYSFVLDKNLDFRNFVNEDINKEKIISLKNKQSFFERKLLEIDKDNTDLDEMNFELISFFIGSLKSYRELLEDGYEDKEINEKFKEFISKGRESFLKEYYIK